MDDADRATVIADDLFRRESARLIAALTRVLGPANLALAEDVVQDALLRALHAWRSSVPDDPAGGSSRPRRTAPSTRSDVTAKLAPLTPELESEWTLAATIEGAFAPYEDAANQLTMMFSCCHEDLSEEARVTLILRFLCGLGPREIARAFLVDTSTIDRRLHRGRERLQGLGRLRDVRDGDEVRARLPSVLRALYLLFMRSPTSSAVLAAPSPRGTATPERSSSRAAAPSAPRTSGSGVGLWRSDRPRRPPLNQGARSRSLI